MTIRHIGPFPAARSAPAAPPPRCPSCAEETAAEALRCARCRTWLIETVRCGLCGEIVSTATGHCIYCGVNLIACNLQRHDPAVPVGRSRRNEPADRWFGALLILAVAALLVLLVGLHALFQSALRIPGSVAQTSGLLFGSLLTLLAIGAGIWLFRGSDSLSDLVDTYGQLRTDAGSQTSTRDLGRPLCGMWARHRGR